MAAGHRRRASSPTARLAALLLLNAFAALLLWRLVAAPSASAGGEAPGAPRAAALRAPAPDPAAVARSPLSRRAVAEDLREVVRRWTFAAAERSRGRVQADNTRVAVHVRDLSSGAELSLDGDRSLAPASNMKLVTTAAALVLLGPDWHFETRLDAGGPVAGGHLRGDLIVRAGADPLHDPAADGSVDALLEPLVRGLRERGVEVVEGDLVLDEGTFAEPGPAPGWPDAGQHWADYCALSGGFTANRGCLTARVTPTDVGRPATVVVEPRHHGLPTSIGVETLAGGQLVVRLDALGRAGVLVQGSVPVRAGTWTKSFAHPDPVALFGSVLSGALAGQGVLVRGGVRRERGAPAGEELARLRSPMSVLLEPINTDSDNGLADQLFLALGAAVRGQGTRAGAAAATLDALRDLGVPTDGFVQVDGSGLSADNRLSARQLTALIAAAYNLEEPAHSLFHDSLAVSGDSGKLAGRMKDETLRGRIRAKTGFIAGVSALSGVVESLAGPAYAFSILVEYPKVSGLNTHCWKPMQDELCARLAELAP